MIEILSVFLPLFGFLIAFLGGKIIGDRGAQFVTCTFLIASAIFSCFLFQDVILNGNTQTITLMSWINSGLFTVDWSLRLDTLSVVMMCVITIVSACVHVYSVGYMSHDASKARFMAYLSLFTFAMLMLVTADNLIQLFFGWEGVGVASYLLIGFWNHKHSANAAAMKAFIVNRVGDMGLALGIFTIFVLFGSVQFDEIFMNASNYADTIFTFWGYDVHALTLACMLLFIGACGKSAQLGLHTWLPDAMEGPTPVSALIHAATMVTAGIFLLTRFSPVFEYAPDALMVVTYVGAATALIAATIGLTQFDIKRVIAYSTMSQLGYMFFALGVSAYGAAMFHLMTHAFFKALLFLGAGSVIHAMSDEQDMRNMGGIWRKIPWTYALMWIGSLALAGIPFFAGYFSKDMVLEAAWADHSSHGLFAYWMGVTAAFLTAFYSWRLLIMTFHGKSRANEKVLSHVHESPAIMILPLLVLATGAIGAGYVFYDWFVGEGRHEFWAQSLFVLAGNDTIEAAHHVPLWVKKAPLVAAVSGIVLATFIYGFGGGIAAGISRIFRPIYVLFFNKYYIDELYNTLFLKPSLWLGRFFFTKGDGSMINGLGPDGLARWSGNIASRLSKFQSGYVYHYVFVMIIGLLVCVSWVFYRLVLSS
jgi:NADH-quinone oxidoreductase subunit L